MLFGRVLTGPWYLSFSLKQHILVVVLVQEFVTEIIMWKDSIFFHKRANFVELYALYKITYLRNRRKLNTQYKKKQLRWFDNLYVLGYGDRYQI